MELTVLGGQAWPGPGGAASGYLVRHDGFNLVLELGNGTMARLQEHLALAEVHGLAFSHGHPDHFSDLHTFHTAARFGGQVALPLPLWAPAGFLDTVGAVMSEASAAEMERSFAVITVADGAVFDAGPMRITVYRMAHPAGGVGFRIEAGDAILAYTGDTGPTEAIAGLAADADVFLCEATYQREAPAGYPFHLSGREAGAYAADAGAGRLVLTHLWPTDDPAVTVAQAAERYEGDILVAGPGMRLEVG